MIISLIKCPIEGLGPGRRMGIWTAGCNKNCKGCMSPHAKHFDQGTDMLVDDILQEVKRNIEEYGITGVTISGGEPFLQDDLKNLLKGIEELGIADILLYTGYYLSELQSRVEALSYIGVLIDGPYNEELNDDMPLRGSSNQTIYILNPELGDSYNEYLKQPRSFNIEVYDNKIIIIGLLPKGGQDIIEKLYNSNNL